MKIYVDDESRIKAVGSSGDPDLTEIEINDEGNPFAEWSAAKICCYRAMIENGTVMAYTPYRASSSLEYIDEIGKENEELADKALAADILLGVTE